MTTIGYATLQIIPSLKGVSEAIDKQLGAPEIGRNAGKLLGSNVAAGVRGSEAQISAALSQAVNARGGEKAGQQWADSTASAMAKHLQSAQNSQKLQSSLTYLVKNGDQAGKKFARDMASQLAIELPVQTRAQQIGEKVGTAIGRTIGFGIKAAAVTSIAGIGYTLTKGFQRLESIDQATFKLKALGHSGDEVKTIMDSATASVKGTAFSLSDAATAAASAVAAGIKPGQDLTRYLTDVGDAAAVAGTNFDDMGQIFNKIQTSNKAYTDDLQQLSDRGLPIFQWLQEEYGVTGDALSKMVQDGEVDAEHFQHAIETHITGAAKNMGQSFQGSVDNMETAIARLGAHFLGSIFGDKDGSQLAGPTEAIGKLTEKFDQVDVWVQAHGPQIRQFFVTMADDARAVGKPLGEILGFLGQHPHAIEVAAGAFALFKGAQVLGAIGDVVTQLSAVGGALRGLPGEAETAAAGMSGGLGKGLGGLGFVLRGGVWVLPVAIAATIIWGDRDVKPQTQTSGDPAKGQPQLPGGTNAGVPGSTTPDFAAGPALPPDMPVPPGFEIRDGKLVKIPGGGRAYGGPITGPGGPKSDIIPIWASHGEHMLPADEVGMMGGQSGVYEFRKMLRAGMFAGGGAMDLWKLAVPWGVDPHGGKDGGKSAGPFRSWWDMDWMPPEHPEKVGPGEGWWWHHGPTREKGMPPGGAPWAPPIGKLRPPLPGDFYPGMLPDDEIKRWGFKDGGAVGPDVRAAGELVGTAYSQAKRTDCSGMVARVIDRTLGMPETGLMSTKTAKEWLAARGFKPGIGGPGTISVGWYDHGPNPNDGHMAMTLSDGRPAEAGGSHGIFLVGAGAQGADSPEFDQHMFLPTLYGEGPAGSASSSPFAGGSASAAVTGGAPTAAPSSSSSSSSGGGGSSFSLPSSISGLAAFGLNDLGKGIGATKSGSDLSLFGEAAGAAVSGQVDSALGVLGVNGSPGWLKAISTLVGGISIGGGGSAAPNAATPTGTGTPPPDDPGNMHGSRAGQQPGPVYNITARDTEDAFVKAQRIEREKAAAKLSRF